MATYRAAKEPRDVYYVKCDNCGQEDGPWPSPPSREGKTYCHKCGRVCRENDAFAKNRTLLGAKVIGFRFDGSREAEVAGLLLRKGKRVIEVSVIEEDEYRDEHSLDITQQRFSLDCYTFKMKKIPKEKK